MAPRARLNVGLFARGNDLGHRSGLLREPVRRTVKRVDLGHREAQLAAWNRALHVGVRPMRRGNLPGHTLVSPVGSLCVSRRYGEQPKERERADGPHKRFL